MTLALVDELRRWPSNEFDALLASLTPEEAAALAFAWEFWARPDQIAPSGFWVFWFLFGGKGSGKTRSAAEWIIARARAGLGPIGLIAGVDDDVRDTMIEGESGILECSPPDFMPSWEPSKRRLVWPNRVRGLGFSADEPKRLHGKGFQTAWCDDLTGWKTRAKETFDLVSLNLRIGDARCVMTANPEESELILSLCDDPRPIITTHSETDDNAANLAPALFETLKTLPVELVDRHRRGIMTRTAASNPFRGLAFDEPPIRVFDAGELDEIAVCVDPAEGSSQRHDEWGIGAAGKRADRHVVGLEDVSDRYDEPDAGEAALELLDRWAALYPLARLVLLAEVNRGENRLRSVINAAHWKRVHEGRSRRPPPEIIPVRAKEGKHLRCGDLRGLYLGGLLHHLVGMARAEEQLRGYNPLAPKRPAQDDRIDWWTHAVHHLADLAHGGAVARPWTPTPIIVPRAGGVDPRAPIAASADPRRAMRPHERRMR